MKLLIFFFFFFFSINLSSKDFDTIDVTYYYSKEDFLLQKNGVKTQFRIKSFLSNEYYDSIIFNYKVKWVNEDSSNKIINNLFAIITPHDTLINLHRFFGTKLFSRLICMDSFWFVYSISREHPMTYGGGLIGAAIASSFSRNDPPVVIMILPYENIHFELTQSSVKKCLRRIKDSEGLQRFKNEKYYDLDLGYKYIKEYNLISCLKSVNYYNE